MTVSVPKLVKFDTRNDQVRAYNVFVEDEEPRGYVVNLIDLTPEEEPWSAFGYDEKGQSVPVAGQFRTRKAALDALLS